MLKKLIPLLLIISGGLFAEENAQAPEAQLQKSPSFSESFKYVSVGIGPLPLFFPSVGFGMKSQSGQHGYDINGSLMILPWAVVAKETVLYHFYLKPQSETLYFGFGAAISEGYIGNWSGHHRNFAIGASPELAFGKKYLNKDGNARFIQLEVSYPSYYTSRLDTIRRFHHHGTVIWCPLAQLSYGISF